MGMILEKETPYEEAIEEVPATDLVRVDGRRIYVRERGEGSTLVLLHGFASSSYSFRKIEEPLAKSYRVLAIDLNGFGFTERPDDLEEYRLEKQAGLIAEVIRQKEVGEVVLVGHSYGCAVCMVFSKLFPDLVSRLILISPPSEFAKKPPWYVRNGIGIRVAFLMIHALLSNPKKFHELTLRAFHRKEALPLEASEVYRRGMLIDDLKRTCRGYARAFASGGASSVRYGTIAKPTLVISGEKDSVVSIESCVEVAHSIPGAELFAVPDCGHCPPEERPDEVLKAFEGFL